MEVRAFVFTYLGEKLALVYLRDISERKLTNKILLESEEKYRTLIESAPDSIVIIKNGLIQYVNPFLISLSGYKENELIGKPFINYISSHYKDIVLQNYNTRLKGEKAPLVYEVDIVIKNGNEISFEVTASILTFMGETTELVFMRDIRERKQAQKLIKESEEKYRLIFENSPLGIFSFDDKGCILACNDNFVKLIGSSKEKLIGLNLLNLPDKNINYSVQKTLNGSSAFYEGEYSSVTANKVTHVRCLFTPVNSGGIMKGMGIVEDITDRKSIENKILKLNVELEQLVKERTIELENTNTNLHKEIEDRTKYEELIKQQLQEREILLKEIHHRVKNNMQIIISILNLQASFIKNKKMISILQDSQTRIKTMALVHEKLYQAKDFSNINFKEYITNLLEYLFSSYRSPKQEVLFQIDIKAIPIEMDIIISLGLITNELVSNSFKYAFAGESSGLIEVSLKEYNKENIEYCIRDNGKGLPPGLDYRNTDSLGLQLVCILTEQIHGKLNVQTSDKGTAFSIYFPIKYANQGLKN